MSRHAVLANPDGDDRLLDAFAKGDGQAFEELYRRYSGQIRHYLRHRLDSRADAEDLTQEVFFRVCREMNSGLHGIQTSGGFRGWIFTVARNAATDWLRR